MLKTCSPSMMTILEMLLALETQSHAFNLNSLPVYNRICEALIAPILIIFNEHWPFHVLMLT